MAQATGTFGYDTGCILDQPRISITVTNPNLVIAQRIARCWSTPRGKLAAIGGDPNWGEGIAQYVLSEMTPSKISAAQSSLLAAALRDVEVQSGDVTMTFDRSQNMTVTGSFVSAFGPFDVVGSARAGIAVVVYTFNT